MARLHARTLFRGVAALALCALVVDASLAGETEEEPAPSGWLSWPTATGDWGGARTSLEARGIEIGGGFTAVWQASHRGGIKSRPQGKWTTSWDGEISLDGAKLGLWPGGSAFIHLEGSQNLGIDEEHVGSLFGVNGDEDSTAGRTLQVSEYFYDHDFGDGLLGLRVGKQDATNDLDANAFANDECCQFLNGALVNNPTVPFPDYALGAQAVLRPVGGLYLAAAVLDAHADGGESGFNTAFDGRSDWFVAGEVGLEVSIPSRAGPLPGAYRVGAWHDPLAFEDLETGEEENGEAGAYVSCDQMVYKELADEEDTQGLGLFVRYGYAPDDYSEVEHFWSAGLQYQGLIPSRDDDVLGIGFATGRLGSPARRTARHDAETVLEAYYNVAIGGGTALTLDLQCVDHPGAEGHSALVPGIRLQVDF